MPRPSAPAVVAEASPTPQYEPQWPDGAEARVEEVFAHQLLLLEPLGVVSPKPIPVVSAEVSWMRTNL